QPGLAEVGIFHGLRCGRPFGLTRPARDLFDVACETGLDGAAVQLAEDSAPEPLADAGMDAVGVSLRAEHHSDGREWHDLLRVWEIARGVDVLSVDELGRPDQRIGDAWRPFTEVREAHSEDVVLASRGRALRVQGGDQ